MLPRIKYRNPSIPIQISRHNDPDGPSLLHIYTAQNPPEPSAPQTPTPPSGTPNARNTLTPDTSSPTHTIDIKSKDESQILELLIAKTGATVIKASPEELAELEEIKEFKAKAEKDRVEVREKLLAERREEELLRMARGEVKATS